MSTLQHDRNATRLRVGVIGCGGIARAHMGNLADSMRGEGYAYMDVHPQMAERFLANYGGAYATGDLEQILDDPKIDVVLISSPDNLHTEQALQVLATGKHLFLEKPLATNLADALRVRDAVQKSSGKFMLDLKFRFAPAIQAAREFVTKPVMVMAHAVGDPIPAGHWRHDPGLSSGAIYDLGPHLFDLMYWFAQSEPVRIYAEAATLQNPDSPLVDNLMATFAFANGARAVATIGCAGQSGFASKWLMELFGGDRNATVHAHAQEVTLRHAGESSGTKAELPPVRSTTGDLKLSFESFLQAIAEDKAPPVGIEDGIRVTRMIEAALESARSGQAVSL